MDLDTLVLFAELGRSSHEERGLKLLCNKGFFTTLMSLLSRGAWIEILPTTLIKSISSVAPLTRSVD